MFQLRMRKDKQGLKINRADIKLKMRAKKIKEEKQEEAEEEFIISKDEEKELRDRLKAQGYIDD